MDNWNNNEIQFPRLLTEIRMTGLTDEQYEDLSLSMDLTFEQIDEILARAETKFEGFQRSVRLYPNR